MNPIIFHPEAENELNSTIDFYNRKVSGLGLEFLEEIERYALLLLKFLDFYKNEAHIIRKLLTK